MTLRQTLRLIDIQAKLSLKSDASKYYLGYIWWILEPLLYVFVFYVVFDIVLERKRADFLVFLMCGKLPFLWFTKSVTQASSSIVTSAGLIGKANIPKAVFPLTVIQEGVYRQSAVFAFLLCVVPFYGGHPVTGVWFAIIPVILVLYLMILFFGLLGSILVCYIRDISLLISLGMIFLMFTSGIFWDIRSLPDPAMTDFILTYNPMAFLLDAFRQVLMYSEYPDFKLLSTLALIFIVGIAGDLWLMRKLNSRLALKALTA
ncbi:ABC transporter [Halioglobus maricola]|uniref:Transport permease protein n=1 Tax=Halioglobus maricola TaxID=2601894 RepID=A0A5P9NGJ5_9GAMM|nr:ABC transporter permease [Halioglobus maricola]QFU74324.1 ABC transporter [Halioglobus maricola]